LVSRSFKVLLLFFYWTCSSVTCGSVSLRWKRIITTFILESVFIHISMTQDQDCFCILAAISLFPYWNNSTFFYQYACFLSYTSRAISKAFCAWSTVSFNFILVYLVHFSCLSMLS
jgi:hypothetical protein